MNVYYLAFSFRGDTNVAKITANQLANELLGHTDDILDFKFELGEKKSKESQFYTNRFFIFDQYYVIEISDENQHCFNIYECVEEENVDGEIEWCGEKLVEKNVPWVCIKIEDEKGNELYNITNEI